MTAQCKVLHLLFSHSDYQRSECRIIQSLCVFYWCVTVEKLRWWLSDTSSHHKLIRNQILWNNTLVKSYLVLTFLFFFFFFLLVFFILLGVVAVIRLSTWSQKVTWILCLSPHINGEESPSWILTFFFYFKAHTQCCLHCLNFNKGHMKMATALHWQNIISMWDTHKGESDLNTRQFRIPNSQTDILTIYNIEQIKSS